MPGTVHIPQRPKGLFDREREWELLAQLDQSNKAELLILIGRRRAGKSFLLTRFAEEVGGVYYQATRKTEREQLTELSRTLARRFDDVALRHTVLPTWEALLDYISEKAGNEPFTFVLDEFPYLVDTAPALPSIIQKWWDHEVADKRLTLVLSGSHISAMKQLVESDQPLYGRRTGKLNVRPFDYFDAARFAPEWASKDKVRLYAIFGGLPGHLALIDPGKSLAENAAAQLFHSSGRLHDEAAHVFDAFLGEAAVHYSIVEAIANGNRTWSGISNRVGKQTSALSRPLEWLLDMEVVERVAPITEYPRPSPKRTLYRLSDPYLTFWYRFVSDVKSRGLTSLVPAQDLWEQGVAEQLDERHTAEVFEEVCQQFVARAEHECLPFRPVQVGSYWSKNSDEEVDVAAVNDDGDLLVGECKWGTIRTSDIDQLIRRGTLIAAELGNIRRIYTAFFTGEGITDPNVQIQIEDVDAIVFDVDDLYDLPGEE